MDFREDGVDLTRVPQKFPLREAVGRNIICEDGIARRVVNICFSYRFKWKAIVNETDPDASMGHFVSLLSLAAQVHGKPLPTKDQEAAFARMIRAADWDQAPTARYRMGPGGLIVPV